jgi:hypothetical protein
MATQKSCSYAEKKGIRESHAPCERSDATVDSDVPRHKNDSCGCADALAGVISPESVKAVSHNTGRQTPLPSNLIIATFAKVNLKALARVKTTDLPLDHRLQAALENRPLQQTSASYIQWRPPLRTSGYTARRLVRAFEYGAARNRLRIVQPGPRGPSSQ